MQDFEDFQLEGFTEDGTDSLMFAQMPTPKATGTHDDLNDTFAMYGISPNDDLDLGELNFGEMVQSVETNGESKDVLSYPAVNFVNASEIVPAAGTVSVSSGNVEHPRRASKRARMEPKYEASLYNTDGESDDDEHPKSSRKSYASSLYSDDGRKKDLKCMSKNAVAARENRQRKKQYIHNLERKVAILTAENGDYQKRLNQTEKRNDELTEEVEYLKNVVANVDGIKNLVKHISTAPGLTLVGTSLSTSNNVAHSSHKSSNGEDQSVRRSSRLNSPKSADAGICFHINNNNLALEFCKMCSSKAKQVFDKHNRKSKSNT